MRRREPRGVGLYKVCAILVVLFALSVLFGIGAEAPPSGVRLSDFVIPAMWLSLAVTGALVQIWHQTLLGWALLLAGFTFIAAVTCYGIVTEHLFEPWLLTVAAILIAICVGLVWYRPRR